MVEDDPASRKALQSLLRRHGWDVTSASNLAEALASLQSAPDVLILDLMLPDGDGSSLLRLIRDRCWTTRVIVTTGTIDWAQLENVRQLHPDAILSKPVEFDHLLQTINRPS